LKTAAKQLVSFIFEWLAAENFWMHNFSEIFQKFVKIREKQRKKFENSSKTASFLHF